MVLEATDTVSGLNPRRRGLRKVIQAAEQKQFQWLLVEYPDRLARFGYEYLVDSYQKAWVKEGKQTESCVW